MKSILQEDKECYITHQKNGLHKHHVFGGPNRKISEREGFYIYLIPELHNMSDRGIHFNKEFDLFVKKECQKKFEEKRSREEFMKIIGKNYL